MKRESPAALTSRRYSTFAESIIYRPCVSAFRETIPEQCDLDSWQAAAVAFPPPTSPDVTACLPAGNKLSLIYTLGVMQISRRETSGARALFHALTGGETS